MKRFKPVEEQRLLDELAAESVQIKTKVIKIDGVNYQVLLIKSDYSLLCYKYNRLVKSWSYIWKKEAFFSTSDDFKKNPWLISADGLVVSRTEAGIHVYKFDKRLELSHVTTDGRYHDAYGWNQSNHVLLFGYFYADPNKIGILSRNGEGKISFEAIVEEKGAQQFQLSIWKMDTDPHVPAIWSNIQSDISLAYIDSSSQQAVVTRALDKLSVFKFGKNHVLEQIMHSPLPYTSKEADNVFFGNFVSDNRMIKNVLHINETGLTGYTYNSSTQKLKPIMYSTKFAGKLGWTSSHIDTVVLEDIDGDGLDELLYCGPSGFNVVKISSDGILADIVLSENEFEVSDRHMKAFILPQVLPGEQQFVSASENGIKSFKLQLQPDAPAKDTAIAQPENEMLETSIPLLSQPVKSRSVLPLHDQLDFTGFIYPRNPVLGTLEFSVPLIEIPNSFGITISQTIQFKEYGTSDVLGPGWSLPADCIYIDRQGSIFSIDHNYYLVKNGMQSQLHPKLQGSRTNHLSFTLSGSGDVEITFYRSQNKWEIKTKHELYSYGTMQNVDWIQWEPGSEEWPVVSNSTAPVKVQPFAWFLSKREDNHGNYLKFVYDPQYGKLSTGVPFVQKLDLLKITSSNRDSIRFNYGFEQKTKLLTSINTRTASYTQNIQFKYSVIESLPRLTSISQLGIPVLQFRYKGPKSEISEIVYPNGLVSKLSYNSLTFPAMGSANKFNFHSDIQVRYGPNYLLIGGKTDAGQVHIKARDVVGSKTTQMSGLIFPVLGKESVNSFQIHTAEQFFVVLLDHKNHKEVCMFRKESNGWSSDASYMKLSKDSTLKIGKSFILVRNDKRLAVLQDLGRRWDIKPVLNNIAKGDIIHAFSYGYVVYNDLSMTIGFQSDDGTWNVKNVHIDANLVKSSLLVFDQFDTDQETIDKLKNGFKKGVLHIHHNAVIVRSLCFEGKKLILRLHFKIFNSAFELFNDETVSVLVEDLDEYIMELPPIDDNFFKIGYKLINGKFKASVTGHTGKIIDVMNRLKGQVEEEIKKHPHASEKEKHNFRKESFEKLDNDLNDIYRNLTASIGFAIDPAKFGVYTNNDNVLVASHKFQFDGNRWNHEKVPETEINISNLKINIGTSFLLTKYGKNESFKLQDKDGKLVWNLNTPFGDILLSYPAFIGVQNNKSAEIFTFFNQKVHQLPGGELLSQLSNHLAVVTISDDQRSATVRSMKSFTNYRQNVITKQELFHSDTDVRTSVFEYDSNSVVPYSDGYAFSKSKIVPDGKSQKYGWYEDSFSLMDMKNSTKTARNAKGVIVKVIEAEENEPHNMFEDDKFITDKMRKIEIVDVRPYRISQEVVSYYGFELYEVNRIGSNKRWIFQNIIVTEQNSNHFLRLEPASSIEGNFKPAINGLNFLFSCWIRANQTSIISDIVHLDVVDRGGKLLNRYKGTIKSQIADWQYVEAICNWSGQSGIGINVKLTNPSSTSVDVDHLRMTPLDFNFQANILEPHNGKIKAVLKNSGMLQQKLLDPIGNEIGHISEKGTLDVFIMKSQNCAFSKNKVLNSRVEMRPMVGEIDSVLKGHNVIKSLKYKPSVFSFRLLYNLTGLGNVVITLDHLNISINRNSNHTQLNVNNYASIIIDSEGEMTVLLLSTKLVLWVQGHLILEKTMITSFQNVTELYLRTTGQAYFSEILYMYDPSIKVFYLNKLGLLTQEIVLKNQDAVNVRHILYDAIDRPVLKTKWIELQPGADSFFNYNPKIITNLDSILENRKAEGLSNDMNPECQGTPFSMTSYRDDPLEVKIASGLPGKAFSIEGQYSTKFGSNPNLPVLKVLFPQSLGYTYEFELNSSKMFAIQVFDQRKNKVAELVKVVNHDHRLTTFEYDENNRLLCVLPPMYHHKVKTFSKAIPFYQHTGTADELLLRDLWGKHYKYDTHGRLIEKLTPDSGKQTFIYTDDGLPRFLVQNSRESASQCTTYYTYRYDGKIYERGIIDVPRNELHKYVQNNATLPKSNNFVMFSYGENENFPMHRSLMQKSRRVSNGVTVIEALLFDEKQELINQIFVSQNKSLSFNYKYRYNKIYEIEYPFLVRGEQLKITYDYNLSEKINAVKIGNRTIADFAYTPLGMIKDIQFEPQSKFSYKRSFIYNEPGYLSLIEDKFLSETISYISNSYGEQSFGDGTVSATKFNATWHDFSNISSIKLKWQSFLSNETTIEQAHLCFETLQKVGLFDNWNRPVKSFYPSSELQMPLVCNTGSRANHISSIITTKGFPLVYGHRYDYENHKQLIKAKYFQNSEEMSFDPLTQLTFSKFIPDINATESRSIWNALKNGGFIITDCSNSKTCHAVQGKSLFHPIIANHINVASLEVLFASGIKSRKDIPEQIFMIVCQIWHKHDTQNWNQICSGIWKELLLHNLAGSGSEKSIRALNPDLWAILKKYNRHSRDIVELLHNSFTFALGKSSADIESYDIDPNGNHVHFYTGFKRYRLEYKENTNKISKVFCTDLKTEDMRETEFLMDHDSEGNVTKVLHKGIIKIVYDPLLKRAIQIAMVDGRTLTFQYDIRGERIFKQVRDKTGGIVTEKYYMRDVRGRCLVDYELTYLQNNQNPHVRSTAYIFGEDALLGFIRHGQFYSVYNDHEGSVRLVIKDGEVVAAYDYLPYGQLLRTYNTDPDGSIAYLYTGQEWDEEIGLFNFHARLYDPEIGRFYQIDPKEQYPSPYVYAGNSPISLVDPDGQFAFIAVIAFAAVGAYLGASSANNSFNPTKWKLVPTLVGGIMGGIVGGLAPGGIGASFSFLTTTVGLSGAMAGGLIATTSVGFTFLSGASANKNWNPAEWNWSSPATWNSLFTGSVTGGTLFAGFGKVHAKFITMSGLTDQMIFVGIVTSSTVGVALFAGSAANEWNLSFWEWNWKNPDTVWKVTMGASFGMSVSPDLHNIQTQVTKNVKDFRSLVSSLRAGNMEKLVSDAKVYFTESHELMLLVKQTFKDLTKQVLRPGGSALAQSIVTSKKAESNGVIETIRSVMFIPIGNFTDDITESLDSFERLERREGLRRKREVNCCQLQSYNLTTVTAYPHLLNTSDTMKLSLFSDVFRYLNSYFKPWFHSSPSEDPVTNMAIPKTPKKTYNSFILNNCYRFNIKDQYIRVRCYGSDAQYDIFPALNSRRNLVDDFYFSCSPIEHDGQPSVVCHGESSNLIFTPKSSVNIIDAFNGWLMLALVAPTAFKMIKQSARAMFSSAVKSNLTALPAIKNNIDILKDKILGIRKLMLLSNETKWIMHIMEDLTEDVDEFSKNPSLENFDDLIDRIGALEEELIELIGFTDGLKNKWNFVSLPVTVSNTNVGINTIRKHLTSSQMGIEHFFQRNILD